jgi:hypothetical protein
MSEGGIIDAVFDGFFDLLDLEVGLVRGRRRQAARQRLAVAREAAQGVVPV